MISRRQFLRWLATLGATGALTAAYGIGIEPLLLRVARYDLRPPRWPQGLELSIAAVADIHACRPWMSEERIGAIVDRTNELGADLIVLLGDYLVGHRYITSLVEPRLWAAELARLKAPLGVHAIMGNHDWWSDHTA